MGKKKETQGLLDQKTRLIGIAAAGHSVGDCGKNDEGRVRSGKQR